jgi:hypothetical protein
MKVTYRRTAAKWLAQQQGDFAPLARRDPLSAREGT